MEVANPQDAGAFVGLSREKEEEILIEKIMREPSTMDSVLNDLVSAHERSLDHCGVNVDFPPPLPLKRVKDQSVFVIFDKTEAKVCTIWKSETVNFMIASILHFGYALNPVLVNTSQPVFNALVKTPCLFFLDGVVQMRTIAIYGGTLCVKIRPEWKVSGWRWHTWSGPKLTTIAILVMVATTQARQLCYAGGGYNFASVNQDSPVGLDACVAPTTEFLDINVVFVNGTFYYNPTAMDAPTILGASTAEQVMAFILENNITATIPFLQILNHTSPWFVCGNCLCVQCNGGSGAYVPGGSNLGNGTNPNITYHVNYSNTGPWFPNGTGALPVGTPPGWNVSNNLCNPSEYCLTPACPVMTSPIILTQENMSLCGGCKRVLGGNIWNSGIYGGVPVGKCLMTPIPYSWVTPNYDFYKFISRGCFEGYATQAECVANTYAQIYGCMYYGDGSSSSRWCPTQSAVIDPVICNRTGVFDRVCTESYYSGGVVDGDPLFCSLNVCNSLSQCKCYYAEIDQLTTYFIDDAWQHGVAITDVASFEISNKSVREITVNQPQTELCFVSEVDGVLKVVFSDAKDRFLRLEKDSAFDSFVCEERICYRSLDDAFFVQSGTLDVLTLSDDRNWTCTADITILGKTTCYVYDCSPFCPEDFKTFNCLKPAHQAGLIVATVLIGVLIFLVATIVLILLIVYRKAIARCLCFCPMMFWKSQMARDTGNRISNVFNYVRPDEMPAAVRLSPLALMMMFLVCCDACDVYYIQQTNLTSCVTDPSGLFEVCDYLLSAEITLPYLSSTACLTLLDENGDSVTELQVRLSSFDVLLTFDLVYYSAAYEPITSVVYRCNLMGGCKTQKCQDVHGKVRDMYGNFEDPRAVTLPGESFCTRVNSGILQGWSEHCPLSSDCVFSAYGLEPTGTTWAVSDLRNKFYTSTIDISGYNAQGNFSATLDLSDSPEEIIPGTSINFGGVEWYDEVVLDGYKLLVSVDNSSATEFWLARACNVNQPIAGQLGDFQSNTADIMQGTTQATGTNVAWDPNTLLRNEVVTAYNDGKVEWQFMVSGTKHFQNGDSYELPGEFGGYLLIPYSGHELSYTPKAVKNGRVYIETTAGQITRSISSICPEVTDGSGSGCFSCSSGVLVILKARSTCTPGMASVTVDSDDITLQQSAVFVGETLADVSIRMSSSKQYPKFKICLVGATTDCVSLSLELLKVEGKVNNDTKTVIIEDQAEKDASGFGGWLGNFFSGVLSWWEYFLTIGAIIVGVIILLVILWFAWPFIWQGIKSVRKRLNEPKKNESYLPVQQEMAELQEAKLVRRNSSKIIMGGKV